MLVMADELETAELVEVFPPPQEARSSGVKANRDKVFLFIGIYLRPHYNREF